MVTCSNCAYPIPSGQPYCPSCSTPVEETQQVSGRDDVGPGLLIGLLRLLWPKRATERDVTTHMIATIIGYGERLRLAVHKDQGDDKLHVKVHTALENCVVAATVLAQDRPGNPAFDHRRMMASYVVRYLDGIRKLPADVQVKYIDYYYDYEVRAREMLSRHGSPKSGTSIDESCGLLAALSFAHAGLDDETLPHCAAVCDEALHDHLQYCRGRLGGHIFV